MSKMYKRTKNDPRLTKDRKSGSHGFARRIRGFFLRRGTNPWKVNLTKKSVPWAWILSLILVISVPLTVIMSVDNGLMRLPDLYKYHFLSNEILNERMVATDETKVAQLMSDYLVHKADVFQMKEDLEYMPADVFTKSDGIMMKSLRTLLDTQAVVGMFMLLISILLIIFIIRQKEKDLLLRSFYYSLPVFALIKIFEVVIMMFGPLRNRVFGIPTAGSAGEADLIPALLDGSFFRLLAIAEVAVSLVLMGVLYYIILNLSGRKTTFRR